MAPRPRPPASSAYRPPPGPSLSERLRALLAADPIVIQPKAGQFVAFDAVCPHAGCTVEFAQSQDILVCPCHGSLFNPSTGAVEQGPAASGLPTIPVTERSGQLYVT